MTKSTPINNKKYVSSIPKKHHVKVDTQHWQLRNMLKVDDDDDLLFFTNKILYKYNYKTREANKKLEFDFKPTSLAHEYGITVIGGSGGEIVISSNKFIHRRSSGNEIINGVQIYKHNGNLRLLVCSNDSTLKTYDIETQETIGELKHKTAVNNCEVSPDSKMLVSVCDSSDVFSYSSDGYRFSNANILKGSTDAGFNVSWNRSGSQFAISAQDGFAHIWDPRKEDRIGYISSFQSPNSCGAVRSVLFTKDWVSDLLLMGEHTSYATLVDMRSPSESPAKYRNRQVINIDPERPETWITGTAFSKDHKSLFLSSKYQLLEFGMNVNQRTMFQEGGTV